jgi:uncharacterized membrane protein YhaH (DUF805 family)
MQGNVVGSARAQAFSWSWFFLHLNGRVTRFDYWVRYFLGYVGLLIVCNILDFVLGTFHAQSGLGLFGTLLALAAIWPGIAVSVKRCHDRDRSGWFLLWVFLPIIGAIWLLVELGFLRGTQGENRFGPDPLSSG